MEAQIQALKKKRDKLQSWKKDPVPLLMAAERKKIATQPFELKHQKTLDCMGSKITGMSWAQDSKRLLVSTTNGRLILWNAYTATKEIFVTMKGWPMCCALSPNGKMMAGGGLENKICIYSVPKDVKSIDPELTHTLNKHSALIFSAHFLSDSHLLSTSGDETAMLWDLSKPAEPVSTFKGHSGEVLCSVPMTPNTFVTGSADQTAKVWDIRTKQSVMTFGGAEVGGHDDAVSAVAICPTASATTFATGCEDSVCRLFDMRSCKQMNVYADDSHKHGVTSITFNKSGTLLYAAYLPTTYTESPSYWAWDVMSSESPFQKECHNDKISCITISPNGKALVTGSSDGNCMVWA